MTKTILIFAVWYLVATFSNFNKPNQSNTQKTKQLLNIASSQVGIREATRYRDETWIRHYAMYRFYVLHHFRPCPVRVALTGPSNNFNRAGRSRQFLVPFVCTKGLGQPPMRRKENIKIISAEKLVLGIANSQVGIREATGNNDGPEVEKYLRYTGNKKGEPWCAAFVSWIFAQAGFKQPLTAWSPSLFPKSKLAKQPLPAMVFGIYFIDKGRIAHAGLIEKTQDNWLYTIEGNTNVNGSREGDGVYRKIRHVKTIKAFANWLSPEKKGGANEK